MSFGRQEDISNIRNTTTDAKGRPYMRNIFSERNVYPKSQDEEQDEKFVEVMKKYFHIYNYVGMLDFKGRNNTASNAS